MHQAILHIGTEKTGSTAIQNYLYHNSAAHIKHHDILFPFKTCGLISNFRLVLYTKSELDMSLARIEKNAGHLSADDPQGYAHWKTEFSLNHTNAIKAFQESRTDSLVVYSSEHFHSRVHDENDINYLKTYLESLYEKVTIIFYARRQDQFALSAYNTAVQSGRGTQFSFSDLSKVTPYYNYLSLATRWSNVFGTQNVQPIIFDSSRLKDANVAKDFEAQIGLDENTHDLSKMKYHNSNERLSYSALQVLVAFNLMDATDTRLKGVDKNSIRQQFVREVASLKDDYGTIRPARSEVDAFYTLYKASNEIFANTWLDGDGFSTDFSMYPENANEKPVVQSDELLTKALANCKLK